MKELSSKDRELPDALFKGEANLDRMEKYIKTVVRIAISGPDVLAAYQKETDLAFFIGPKGMWKLHMKGRKLYAVYSCDERQGSSFIMVFSSEPGRELLLTEYVEDVYDAIPVLTKGLLALVSGSSSLRWTDWKCFVDASARK